MHPVVGTPLTWTPFSLRSSRIRTPASSLMRIARRRETVGSSSSMSAAKPRPTWARPRARCHGEGLAAFDHQVGVRGEARLGDRVAQCARRQCKWGGERAHATDAIRTAVGTLVTLTVVTGLVDAVSYLALGHVFVANMTGNVVFLGFAVAGAPGLSAPAALAALAAFLIGASAGGRIAIRSGEHRGRQLRSAMTVAGASLLLAVLLAAILGQPVSQDARYALIVPLAVAMGIQNATARRLAVPDLTTTVLTHAHRHRGRLPARRRTRRPPRPSPDRRGGNVHRRAPRRPARDPRRPRAPPRDRPRPDRDLRPCRAPGSAANTSTE